MTMRGGTFRWRARELADLERGIRDGLGDVADQLADGARARAQAFRDTGATAEGIRVDKDHLYEDDRPAAFVMTTSGDGFFVHSGTEDTAPHPIFSEEIDAIGPDGIAQTIAKRTRR
jgi:hypothetical protein